MKKLFLFLILATLFFSCSDKELTTTSKTTEEDKAILIGEKSGKATFDFQKDAKCITALITDQNRPEASIKENLELIIQNGFSKYFEHYPSNPNWSELDRKYQVFMSKSLNPKSKNIVRQVGCFQILVNHALLAEPDKIDKISYYLNEYLDSGGESSVLVYYCLKALGNKVDISQANKWIKIINERHTVWTEREMQITGIKKNDLTNIQLIENKDPNNFLAHEVRLLDL